MPFQLKLTVFLLAGLVVSPMAWAADCVWLVAGAGGEPKYENEFRRAAEAVYTSLIETHHYSADHVRLFGASDETPGKIDQDVTLDELKSGWTELVETVQPDDTFLLILLGHGQSDFVEPKFTLKGPDLGGQLLTTMFEALPAKEKNAILSFPCSGHFSELLSPVEGVSVIASTDGPRQIFHSVMHGFLLQAFQDEWSDQDGDGALTIYELYQYLSGEVDDYYAGQDFVQISNVSLDDNGDGRVTTTAEGMDAGDGERARTRRLCPAPGYVEEPETPEDAES